VTGNEKKRLNDYRECFTSVHGKRVMEDLYRSYCGPTFCSDALEMARREGRREVVLMILRALKQDRIMELEQEDDD
jgi:hypothetical protein